MGSSPVEQQPTTKAPREPVKKKAPECRMRRACIIHLRLQAAHYTTQKSILALQRTNIRVALVSIAGLVFFKIALDETLIGYNRAWFWCAIAFALETGAIEVSN